MSKKRQYRRKPLPNSEPMENRPHGINGDANSVDFDDEIGSESHKKQALRYFDGQPRSGRNKQFRPSDIEGQQMEDGAGDPGMVGDARNPGGPGNDLSEFVDQSGIKPPYGGRKMGWAANAGKLGDLDPQETDQPAWINTWSHLNTGPGGCGVTIDENYGAERPRTFSKQKHRFAECNPEFQDVADDGDWTSAKWTPNV